MDAPTPISVDDARAALEAGTAILVDVREPDAYATAHPPPARSIPIGALAEQAPELADGRLVITSCGGGTRGPKAAAQLRALGIEARPLHGGLRGWRSAGAPVTDDGQSG